MKWYVLAWVLSFVAAAYPVQARAFCRATTKSATPMCPSRCENTGLPLYWSERDLSYAFHVGGFPGVAEATLREAFQLSFAQWEQIDCGGEESGFVFRASPTSTNLTAGPLEAQPDENVIILFDASTWQARSLPSHAFAITAVWFETDTGEIVDADMQFNGGLGQFVPCEERGCAPGQIDIRNVATHEIGHFVGLAHSDDPSSAMWCSALPTDLGKRSLSPDDQLGFCAIYPMRPAVEQTAGEDEPPQRGPDGCAVAAARSRSRAGSAALFALGLASLWLRRRAHRVSARSS